MPRRSLRQLSQLLQMALVDDSAVGPQVSDNIQLGYQVDDLSHLVRPFPVRVAGARSTLVAAGAGIHSGWSFQAGPAGSWILWLEEPTSGDSTVIVAGPTSDMVAGTVQVPGMLTGINDGGEESIFRQATRVGLPANHFIVRNTQVLAGIPLYIPGGQFFEGMRSTANATNRQAIIWQEVPSTVELM